jgi:apolipoprotein N-acyltransferase
MLRQKTTTRFVRWLPLTGLLLYAAWPPSTPTALVFIGLVPLLWLEANTRRTAAFFCYLLFNLLTWNLATTWWVWNASPGGAVGAILANSVLMCFPWMAYRYARKKLGNLLGYATLVCCWLGWEYLHHNWDLSWPWLTLGNAFAMQPGWVNWYKYTGTTGGSIWILVCNIFIFNAFCAQGPIMGRQKITAWLLALTTLAVPAVASLLATKPAPIASACANVVVVQPNVEPYNKKFDTDPAILVADMIRLAEQQIDSNTRVVLWPETAIPAQTWEQD